MTFANLDISNGGHGTIAVRWPFLMNDGTAHPTQKYLHRDFRTKNEAIQFARVQNTNQA